MQRALLAVLLLAVAGGLLGTWIVLRRLAFFAHAVGSATFPGLVVAGPWGIAPPLAALARRARLRRPAVAPDARAAPRARTPRPACCSPRALALGAILASDVYRSGAGVDRLLFGTLLGLSDGDLWLAGARRARRGRRDRGARAHVAGDGLRPRRRARARRAARRAATGCCSRCSPRRVVAVLPAVGALLVSTLLVVPAATARLLTRLARRAARGGVALAAAEGVAGLLLAYHLDLPPGPAIAVIGGGVFALAALASARGARAGGAA